MAAAKNEEETLTLVSSDDKRFEVSMEAALMSKLVRSILEGDSGSVSIQIKKLKGDTLGLIVKYMKYHNGKKPEEIAKPLCFEMKDNVADKWDAEYIDAMKKETIYQVIVGANYMDVPSLLHLGCAKIATLIKGQSLEDIDITSVMTMNQQKSKRRAVILFEHWLCSEGKLLDANLRGVVSEHYAGGFEFDPKLCHKTLKLSNGNKTVTMTTNESASVYSKNMICSKRMVRLQWELTLKAKLDADKGDCMMGILDAKHIKNVDTSKMFANGDVGVSIGHNGSLWAHKGKGGGQEVYASTPQWNIGDRLMLDFDLKRRRCTVFLNDQLQGTLTTNLPESFFCVANACDMGTALETTRFEVPDDLLCAAQADASCIEYEEKYKLLCGDDYVDSEEEEDNDE